jgi:SnoaL-like domain
VNDEMLAQAQIRDLLERWVITRDSADWQGFAAVWHPRGPMMATWFEGDAEDFIDVSREGFA